MVKRFFSVPVPIFGSVAMLLLCTVFFLLPFALRGARLGLNDMQNNVADWLPDHYTETKELREFQKYFYGGDQFVVVSGPWCKEGDPRYTNLLRKIYEESMDYEKVLKEAQNEEELRARRKGDELGLLFTGNYHEDWGEQREKWLMGKNGQWYFIKRTGELFRWKGQNNVVEGAKRTGERMFSGKNKAVGTSVAIFGAPPDDAKGIENPFYADPQKLCCRPFKSVISGPDIFQKMAGPDGTLRIGNLGEDSLSTLKAKDEADKRLTGALFGPTPVATFNWTFDSLLQHVDDVKQKQLRADPDAERLFDAHVKKEVNKRFDGDMDKLATASDSDKIEIWNGLWYQLGHQDPPPRQTCLIVTLNEPVKHELARVVGRPILGKPRGRLLELATGECGILPENVHIGGPPSDNVAIDEEGTSTLLRLVSLSLIIGLSLAYLSFGSVRVALMLFFVGGVAAISSLSYVWFAGQTTDAILMSMPSLVYVLALSSAVHIVNYYRDACYEDGPELAVEKAVKHSWFPCTLAAFTTALGLVSLTTSKLTPIYKFGLFSAIGTMATVALLFTYLPSALSVWKPGYKKRSPEEREKESGLSAFVGRTWSKIGDWVIDHHWFVTATSVAMLIFFAIGVTRIETSVQLLKLFDSDAKVLHDYRWLEENLGELVPAEIAIEVAPWAQKEPYQEKILAELKKGNGANVATQPGNDEEEAPNYSDQQKMDMALKYSMLERVELSRRVRQQLERHFGSDGMGIVGSGMSTDVFTPLYQIESQETSYKRIQFSQSLYDQRNEMAEQDYLAVLGISNATREERERDLADPDRAGQEIWRVSIRLAALNNVDYGQFVSDLKSVVEPILTAYRYRTEILRTLQAELGPESLEKSRVLVLARDPDGQVNDIREKMAQGAGMDELIDQTYIFSDTLQDLLENRGLRRGRVKEAKFYQWLDPDKYREPFQDSEKFANYIGRFDCVVFVEDDPLFNPELIAANAKSLVDCRNHVFKVDPDTKQPIEGMFTAREMKNDPESSKEIAISTMYTGIIPIVYKAQRSLLQSLIESIGLAFIMISLVMMLLLREWRSPVGPDNLLNIRGGMISMLPNVFPIVMVFGFMGHMNQWYGGTADCFLVDIGSMMTASVAMGVAVDDTIHFLNWYRYALAKGLPRKKAIKEAYSRVATAMTQTTLIGGFGLSAFALSTFTPTQRFGVLMLVLLVMALVGDLILLPALLAGPLGKYFGKERPQTDEPEQGSADGEPTFRLVGDQNGPATGEVVLPPEPNVNENIRRLE